MSKLFTSIMVASATMLLAFAFLVLAQHAVSPPKILATLKFPLLARIMTDNRVAHLIRRDQVLLNISFFIC